MEYMPSETLCYSYGVYALRDIIIQLWSICHQRHYQKPVFYLRNNCFRAQQSSLNLLAQLVLDNWDMLNFLLAKQKGVCAVLTPLASPVYLRKSLNLSRKNIPTSYMTITTDSPMSDFLGVVNLDSSSYRSFLQGFLKLRFSFLSLGLIIYLRVCYSLRCYTKTVDESSNLVMQTLGTQPDTCEYMQTTDVSFLKWVQSQLQLCCQQEDAREIINPVSSHQPILQE